MEKGSEALNFALDGTASFGDMMLIIPRDWDQSKSVPHGESKLKFEVKILNTSLQIKSLKKYWNVV